MNDIENLELKISKFLRYGVIVAGCFLALGFILNFRWETNVFYVFGIYDELPFTNQLLFNLYHKRWGMLSSYLGLIILISLPLIRVFLTGVLFLRQKERILASIAFLVFMGLILSFVFGIEL